MNKFLKPINVLVLEDEPNDALLIRRAFEDSGCDAFVCRNTSEAAAYLQGSGMYADRIQFPFPEMFVSDLRLGPDLGIHFLEWLRSVEHLKDLPVIILSGAATAKDILAVQRLAPDRILAKPSNQEELSKLLKEIAGQICPALRDRAGAVNIGEAERDVQFA